MNRRTLEDDQLAKVSWYYYQDNLTQHEVAERMGISRFKVGRLLKRARQEGIVRIDVHAPNPHTFEIERKLETQFGLQEAVVVPTPDSRQELKVALARASAGLMERILEDHQILGVAYASTLYPLPRFLREQKLNNCQVIPLTGGNPGLFPSESIAYDPISRIAETLGAHLVPLYVPAIVDSQNTRDLLLALPAVRHTLNIAARADVCFVGLGSTGTHSSLIRLEMVSRKHMRRYRRQGAVLEFMGGFFDRDGKPVPTEMDRRLICLPFDKLRGIPRVVGVAGGPSKVEAIRAALTGQYLQVLITDLDTAQAVLAEKGLDS